MDTMKSVTHDELNNWCKQRALSLRAGSSRQLDLGGWESTSIEVPKEAMRSLALAYSIVMTFVPDDDESNFAGALIWITSAGMWSETAERVGSNLVAATVGKESALQQSAGFLTGPGEIAGAHALLTLALWFQWDAHYVPDSAQFVGRVSHHGVVSLLAADDQRQAGISRRFQRWQSGMTSQA